MSTEDPAEINEPFKGFKSGVGTKSEGSGDYGGWNQKVEVRGQRLRWGGHGSLDQGNMVVRVLEVWPSWPWPDAMLVFLSLLSSQL